MCNGIVDFFAGVEDIKDSTLDHTASPACKAFSESLLRHLHPLMSLALPNVEKYITSDGYWTSRGYTGSLTGQLVHWSARR